MASGTWTKKRRTSRTRTPSIPVFNSEVKQCSSAGRHDTQIDTPSHDFHDIDYSLIHLPTFTVSARDFTLLSHVDRDGAATCFSNPADTGIPALQSWCHQLTLPFREDQAKFFWQQLREFLLGARSYLSATDTYVGIYAADSNISGR